MFLRGKPKFETFEVLRKGALLGLNQLTFDDHTIISIFKQTTNCKLTKKEIFVYGEI